MQTTNDRATAFVKYLSDHSEDRGMMADLRRGFSESQAHRAWPYLASWCDLTHSRERAVFQTVAAAFAHHPVVAGEGDLGSVLRRIAMGDKRGQEGLATFDGHFRRLLVCDSVEELCDHLRGPLRAAAAKGIPVNYEQMFNDLWYWGEKVRLRWAASYWGEAREGGEA